jgi:glycosyltransferase involved in cell wall biosynthesis
MRIAYICTDPGIPVFGTKGASIHVQEMLRAFLRRGDEVTLFSPRLDDPAPADLERLLRRPLQPAPKGPDADARAAWALATNHTVAASLAAEGPFDLVYERHALFAHAAMEWAAEAGLASVLELNAPLIDEQARHRALARPEEAAASARRAFEAACLVACVSAGAAAYAVHNGAPPGRVEVVPNGVDASRFAPAAPEGPFTVGFLGTLKPWHDTGTLVEAFALLRRTVPDVRLLIVGDGPERPLLESRLDALGLAAAARFTGAVAASEVPGWLARMHVGTAPYHGDQPFYFSPLKLYEYMAAGLAVVASEVGGLRGVLGGGSHGRLVPPGDPAALASQLALLAADPGLRARLGRAARGHVVAYHGWDHIAERVIARACGLARIPA